MSGQLKWKLSSSAPDEYLKKCNLPPVIAQLLYNRGVRPDEMELFFTPDPGLKGNPFLLPDMPQAVSRIYQALLSREKIAIYGDFDVDGVTATAILVEGLSWLGAKAFPYIPDRSSEGHGLNLAALKNLGGQGFKLIITVDCGIGNISEIEQARQMGIDTIVTDHHLPAATLPRATAMVDAKRRDSRYPHPDLAGVSVALKLLEAIFHRDNREKRLSELLDLVVLGTVADIVPLRGENRYLVKEGLKVLNNTERIGLQEMIKLAGLKPGKLKAQHISWVLGPRLNAAGRMDDASTSYRLLTTRSAEEAHLLAAELEEKNAERQRLNNEVLGKVREKLSSRMHLPLLIDGDEAYPVGVIGLVAGRLVDEFHKPAIILNLDREVCHGSCRSTPEFNMASALEKCHDWLTTFGGHPLAAGFVAPRQNLASLEEKLLSLAATELGHLDPHPQLLIDAEIPLSAFNSDTVSLLQKLEPFGAGNPQPTFLSRQVGVAECRNLGKEGKNLELKLKQGNIIWKAVAIDFQKPIEEVPPSIDIVYNLEKEWWSGEEVLRLHLLDFAPAGAAISH